MLTLCLDTSVKNITLALVQDGKLLAAHNELPQEAQSKIMLREIDALLKQSNISLDQINQVLFCHGPGSFTALRVGLATLKGLFWQRLDVEYLGVSSLLFRCFSKMKNNPQEIITSTIRLGRERVAFGVLHGDSFSEKICTPTELEQEYKSLGLGPVQDAHDLVDPEAFLAVLKSPHPTRSNWDETQVRYLMAPDYG